MANESEIFVARVGLFIKTYGMAPERMRILAAVSGGADSMCLLYVLRELGYKLEVAHFDHQTRGGESARDAAFVAETAKRLNLPFHIESRPVEQEAQGTGKSFEEYARSVRYDFFSRTASSRGCKAVATGHHADDNAETVLMRLIRGTTPAGAAGIPVVGVWDETRVIRPLLASTRNEILAWLAEKGLAYREDVTNVDVRYARNRIRHELLPLLEREYNPRVRQALLRFAEAQWGDAALLDHLAERAFGRCVSDDAVNRRRFYEQPEALQRRIVVRLARLLGIKDMPFERVVAAADFLVGGQTGERFDLGAGILLQNGRLRAEPVREQQAWAETPLRLPGVTAAMGKFIRTRLLDQRPAANLAAYCSSDRQVFDADAAGPDLAVRNRRPGDSFQPLGMQGTKKLRNYFIDMRVPAFERDARILLVGGGKILWVVNGAISRQAAVKDSTKRFLEVEVLDGTQEGAALDGGADSEEG